MPGIQLKSFGWLLLGLLAGLGTSLVLAYPGSFQFNPKFVPALPWQQVLEQVAWSIPYQLGYAAVSEEPVFRAFLWGYLRLAGWKDLRICLFQAGIFVLAHIYYLRSAPISFWIIAPTGSLVLGLLAWRTRSITTSMSAHAAINATGRLTELIVASMRR